MADWLDSYTLFWHILLLKYNFYFHLPFQNKKCNAIFPNFTMQTIQSQVIFICKVKMFVTETSEKFLYLLCGIYLPKVKNRSTRTRCEICSKLTIKTPERRQWRRSSVSIVNFQRIIAGWVLPLSIHEKYSSKQ